MYAREVWIIFDPLDGAHVFLSKKEANKTWKRWRWEREANCYNSSWDMSKPICYIRKPII